MKTIYEWIQELPEPHRSRAMKYEEKDWGCQKKSIKDAILCAFVWDKADEGHYYWELVLEGKYDEALKLEP